MARIQIIEQGGWYDGVQIIGGSDAYPDTVEEAPDPEFRQRDWLHRHGIIIDEELCEIETFRWT